MPGATQDTITTYELKKSEVAVQLTNLNKQKGDMITKFNAEITQLDANIKLLTDIEAALPAEVSVTPIK